MILIKLRNRFFNYKITTKLFIFNCLENEEQIPIFLALWSSFWWISNLTEVQWNGTNYFLNGSCYYTQLDIYTKFKIKKSEKQFWIINNILLKMLFKRLYFIHLDYWGVSLFPSKSNTKTQILPPRSKTVYWYNKNFANIQKKKLFIVLYECYKY